MKTIFDIESARSEELFRREDFLRIAGFLSEGRQPETTADMSAYALELLKRSGPGDQIIGHNIFGFDMIALGHHRGWGTLDRFLDRAVDTDYLVRLYDPPASGHEGVTMYPRGYYGLDESCLRYGLSGKTDNLKDLAKRHGGFDLIPLDDPQYHAYLRGDLVANAALYNHLIKVAETPYAAREMNVGLMTAQMTLNGFRVDIPEIGLALEEQADRRKANIEELHFLTGMPIKGVNPIRSKEGNAALEAALIKLGLKEGSLPRTKKTGTFSTGRDDLTEFLSLIKAKAGSRDISKIERIINLIIAISGERTVYQTAEKCRIDDRVHPTIRPLQASGRWSVTDPGLTVYGKRGGKHVERRIFLPEEGHVLLAVDLDQVDARAVAAHSGDQAYLKIFRDGLDLHGENALKVFGRRDMREQVKPISHGWNYGMGARKLAGQGVPMDMAIQFDRAMKREYPDLVRWQHRVRQQGASGELLDNGFGRPMRCAPEFAYTQAPALAGQGCTRDILAAGMLRIPVEYWPYMRVIVHDEVVFSVPERDHEEIGREIKAAMSFDLEEVTDGRLSCPITAGVSKPGKNWAQVYEK